MAVSRTASENHGISYPSIQAASQPFNQLLNMYSESDTMLGAEAIMTGK